MAVAVGAPAVFRATEHTSPERHTEAAQLLGGEDLATRFGELMMACGIPNGISGVGYDRADIPNLVEGALPQQRLLQNAPIAIDAGVLATLFERSLEVW